MKKQDAIGQLAMSVLTAAVILLTGGHAGGQEPAGTYDYDVIIIGGGMGGLSAGAHLASQNLKVLLIEQHDKVGGCTTSFERDGFTFDASLHEMAGGGPGKKDRGLYQLLQLCEVYPKVELIELPHFYRSIFPGIDIRLPNDWEGFKRELKHRWPAEAQGVDQFHTLCSDLMNDLMALKDLFRYTGLKAFFVKALVPLRQKTFYRWKDKSVQDLLDACFSGEEIKAVVSQLWVYYGAPVPEQSALIFMGATDSFLTDGIWHIRGTSQALSDAYAERIKELGGEVITGTLVSKIMIANKTAAGVKTQSGKTYTARYIVCNTDPYQLAYKLIGESQLPEAYLSHLKRLKPANSLFGVYLGLNLDLKKLGYDDTEIFYSPSMDSKTVYGSMMKGDYKNGMVAITIYSNYGDPIYAPAGKSVVVLNTFSDINIWPPYGDAYYKMKDAKVEELVALAARVIPELADPENIEVKEGFTPRTLQRYTLNTGGIVYGFYISPDQWEKVPNTTPIKNVFIASNWSQAWHGVSSAQVNGWRAARLIMDLEGIK